MDPLSADMGRWLYTWLVAAVAAERLFELALSRRNARRLVASGAIEAGASHYPWMVGVHTLFLASCLAEAWLLEPEAHLPLAAAMLGVLLLAMALRYWVVITLGRRWTTRVYVLPGAPRIHSGPYRFVRHPNYVAVCLEIVALPMVHTAWLSAALFSIANALVLKRRIRVEDAALDRIGSVRERVG